MHRNDFQGVIFDMDGLMFDTERLAAECWFQIGSEVGIDVTEDFLSRARGLTGPEYRAFFENHFGPSFDYDDANSKKRTLFWNHIEKDGIPIKTGLNELLRFLKESNIRTAMATASREGIAFRYLDLAGVRPFFDEFVFGNQVTYGKPNPEIFLTAANCLGVCPEKTIVLEDSINGVKAGIAGGFHTIMIPDLTQPTPELEKQLSFKCENLSQVISYMKEQCLFSHRRIN